MGIKSTVRQARPRGTNVAPLNHYRPVQKACRSTPKEKGTFATSVPATMANV